MEHVGKKFDRDQLVTVANLIFTSAWDRIDSALGEGDHDVNREMIHGIACTVGSGLPILYATLTDDGMGIGEFPQWVQFEIQVEKFIEDKLKNPLISHPDSSVLAEEFVDTFFNDYLE